MKKNLPILTGLRFLAAFYVFIFHINMRLPLDFLNSNILSVIKQGAVGVNVFFILSGFILFYNYSSQEINFLEFIFKRLAKIYPVYLAGLLISFLIAIFLQIQTNDFFEIIMMNLLMVQSYLPKFAMQWYGGGSWSISTEFFFYLCFPLLLKIILKLSKRNALIFALFCFLCSTIPGILYNFKIISFPLSYAFPPARVWEFMIGMLVGFLVGKFNVRIKNSSIFIIILLSSVFFFFIGANLRGYVIQNIIVVPLTVIILICTSTTKKNMLSFLGKNFFEFLGKVSYSFYIVQLPIMIFLDAKNNLSLYNTFISLIVIFFINLAGAIILYHFIELPSHKFLNKKIRQIFIKEKPALT